MMTTGKFERAWHKESKKNQIAPKKIKLNFNESSLPSMNRDFCGCFSYQMWLPHKQHNQQQAALKCIIPNVSCVILNELKIRFQVLGNDKISDDYDFR